GHYIDVTNPENWVAFDEAVTAYKDGGWDGIGYAFDENDPYCGIDLDHCVVNGELSETASDWVRRFQTYAEISPSGTGVKLICKAKALHNGKTPAAGAEIYDRTRYFTITGHSIGGYQIEARQGIVNEYVVHYFPGAIKPRPRPEKEKPKPKQSIN